MSRYHSYTRTALELIRLYRGPAPFHLALKQYFARHRQHGSRDRKMIAALCYSYFRAGHAMPATPDASSLAIAYLLSPHPDPQMLEALEPGMGARAGLSLSAKIQALAPRFRLQALFPWPELISQAIDRDAWMTALLQQPGFFVRIRPGYREGVYAKIKALQPGPEIPEPDCLLFPAGFNLEPVLETDREVVVQDRQSQHTLDALLRGRNLLPCGNAAPAVWDCCAASGGKSILAHDLFRGEITLTVTDIRKNILEQLAHRFRRAGIHPYQALTCDLEQHAAPLPEGHFDAVICDAPCTGSGTWGRTPEQLHGFDPQQLPRYTRRQQTIARRTVPHLKPGGLLLYITCSLFEAENEKVVEELVRTENLELLDQQYLIGYTQEADTLFAALMRRR